MATNPPSGDGHRNGMVRERSQTQTPSGLWVKRNAIYRAIYGRQTGWKTIQRSQKREIKKAPEGASA